MKYWLLLLGLIGLLSLSGCQTVVCNDPYMPFGQTCCLDANDNSVCDADEDLPEDEPTIIIKDAPIVEKEIVKYVCENGTLVGDVNDCIVVIPEHDIEIPELAMDNERDTTIETFNVTPACKTGINGGDVWFKVGTVPSEFAIEVDDLATEAGFQEVYRQEGLFERFTSFVICDGCHAKDVDFKLDMDTVYIIRAQFNQTKLFNRLEFSNEHLVDTREDSLYMTKRCAG